MHLQWISTGFSSSPGDVGFMVRSGPTGRDVSQASANSDLTGGSALLVDCGESVPNSLIRLDMLNQLTDIVVTDIRHAGGLARLALIYYIQGRAGTKIKPTLHLAQRTTGALWDSFQNNDLGSMPAVLGPKEGVRSELWQRIAGEKLREIPGGFGEPREASLDDFFQIKEFPPGRESINLDDLPELKLIRNLGDSNVRYPSYGGFFRNSGFYFSGNTGRLPPFLKPDISVFFQYCRVSQQDGGERDVHTFDVLKEKIPAKFKSKTYLVPIDGVFDDEDASELGFAGDVFPFQEFMFLDTTFHEIPLIIDT